MKVAFLCYSLSREFGGIFEIERSLAKWLSFLPETSVEVLGVEDRFTQADLPLWSPLQPRYFPSAGGSSFRYSPKLKTAFLELDCDVAHMHALWTHNSIILNKWSKRWKRPYMITINGMLDGWAVQNSGWKKRIATALYEGQCLRNAACIQAMGESELAAIRDFGLRNPVCLVPNGVELPVFQGDLGSPFTAARKVLLYLGRLHPKKGLPNLLKAWAKATRKSDWLLAIAGWDQGGHEKDLRDLCSDLGMNSSVEFMGPQFGDSKVACYRTCDAVILPSFSEGLPMAVLEAWSFAKPVLMTAQCNIPEGFSTQSAIKMSPSVDGISEGLSSLFSMSDADRQAMGDRGYALVCGKFTWQRTAQNLQSVYSWMLDEGPRPDFVCVT